MKFIKYILFILITWVVCHLVFTVYDGLSDDGSKAELAVVLGNTVNKDGTLSARLTQRLACGLNLYQNNRINKIMVSGGLGKEGHYEAEKMRDYLVKHHVPINDIIVDNVGNNTRLTVKNTLALKKKLGFKRVLVVSQYFHITRTKMLFKKQGIEVSGVSPFYFELRDVFALPREFLAFYTQIL